MQGLLYLQLFGSPGLVKDGSLTPLDGMVGVPVVLCYCSHVHVCLPVSFFVLFQSGLKPPNGLSNVDPPTITGDPVDNLGAFLLGKSISAAYLSN